MIIFITSDILLDIEKSDNYPEKLTAKLQKMTDLISSKQQFCQNQRFRDFLQSFTSADRLKFPGQTQVDKLFKTFE